MDRRLSDVARGDRQRCLSYATVGQWVFLTSTSIPLGMTVL